MKKWLYTIAILGLLGSATVASAQVSTSFWKLSAGSLLPVNALWSLTVPQLGGNGSRCVSVDNNGLFSVAAAACGSGGGSFPFTPTSYGVSTSTTVGFTQGILSTASSTFNSSFYLPFLSQGFLYTGSAGQANTIASSSVKLSWFNNDPGFLTSAITGLTQTYGSTQTGATQTFGTSSDTNIGLTITNPSSNNWTFTPTWIGTLANNRLANPATTVNGQTCTLGSSCTVTATPSYGQQFEVDANKWLSATTTGTYGINANLQGSTYGFGIGGQLLIYASSTNQDTIVGIGAGGQAATTTSTTGGNVFVGYQSGKSIGSNIGGSVAVGTKALASVTSLGFNTAIGDQALSTATGADNTALGASAGVGTGAGNGNIYIGYNAAASGGISGAANIIIGTKTDIPNASNSGQLNVANVLYGTGLYNNISSLSSAPVSNGRIGISSSTPFSQFAIHAVNGSTNTTLFAIASSTASATTTLFSVNNVGTTTLGLFGACNTSNALTTDSSGNITCGAITGTAYTGTWPISILGTTISFGGLGTSTNLTTSHVPYVSGVNTFADVGTSSIANGVGITVTNGSTAFVLGAQPSIACNTADTSTFGCLTSANWNTFNGKENALTFNWPLTRATNTISYSGLATTSIPTAGNLFYSNGTTGLVPIATSSLGVTGPITFSGTIGSQIGGVGGTFGCATCATFAWPWTVVGASSISTTSAVNIIASTTIGNGTAITGLTVNGGATTTDVTNAWSGVQSPTRSFVLSTGTTTTWTASTTGTGYSPFMVMPFAGTLKQVRCLPDASFVGVNVQVNGSNATPSYFVASTTVGKVSITSGNTFTAGQKILANFGTSTTATTLEISCTFDVIQTVQ